LTKLIGFEQLSVANTFQPNGELNWCAEIGILNACKRKPSPDFSDEGLVDFSLSGYFLQHAPGQHFALPLQQPAAADVAVAALMNAAKVTIIRRYFIRSSS